MKEFDTVSLVYSVYDEKGTGEVFSAGSIGTIVHAYPGGERFEVEFSKPFSTVLTLRKNQIEAS